MNGASLSVAVMMGDLVKSQTAADIVQLHDRFNRAIATANQRNGGDLASPLTVTLGDEFQGLATSLVSAATIMRGVRHDLLADDIDCRVLVGVARIATPINRERAWNMMGEGLGRARGKLNEKTSVSRYRFSLTGDERMERILDALGAGLTRIEATWSDRQRRDVLASLAGASPADIARARNVSAHSVYKVRSAGGYDAYLLQWAAIDDLLRSLDEQRGEAK